MNTAIYLIAVICLLTGSLRVVAQNPTTSTANPPNVLFLNVDDLNDWNTVLDGHPQAITPNLDALAKRGMTFRRAVCASPVCMPSRTALLTGIHPENSGVFSNFNRARPWRFYAPDVVTLPKHFANNGYTTIGGGKIFNRWDAPEFDIYWKSTAGARPIPGKTYKRGSLSWGVTKTPGKNLRDARVVSRGIKELRKADPDKPLFLSIGIYLPHVPWIVPQKYFDMYPLDELKLPETIEGDLDDLPERLQLLASNEAKFGDDYHGNLIKDGQVANYVRAYLASVTFADEQLGRMIRAWDKSPQSKGVYIVLWSDHGYMVSEKGGYGKFKPWFDANRVNFMVVGPGIEPGTVCDRAVSLMDVYPTLVELAGLPRPTSHELDGNNLMPLLADADAAWDKPVVMSHEEDGIRYDTVYDNRYRLTQTITDETELYDHKSDPHEWHNLAADPSPEQLAIIDRLSQHLTFSYPKIPADGWIEAEAIPTQTSADLDKRGNFHYPLKPDWASGKKVIHAELIKGKGSYLDFVLQIDKPGTYQLETTVQHLGPSTFVAYFDEARPLAAQADFDFAMTRLENAIIAPKNASESNRPIETIKLGEVAVTKPGLHIVRFMYDGGKNTQLRIDRLRLLRLNMNGL